MYTLVITDEFDIKMINKKQRWSIAPCSLESARRIVKNAYVVVPRFVDTFAKNPVEELLEYGLSGPIDERFVGGPNTRLLVVVPHKSWREVWEKEVVNESDVRFWYCVRN